MRRILARLGEDATFTPAGGDPATVKGVFTAPHVEVQLGALAVSSSKPTFAAMSEDLPGVSDGDTLLRAGIAYMVRVVRLDDPSGVTVLELEAP